MDDMGAAALARASPKLSGASGTTGRFGAPVPLRIDAAARRRGRGT
jgi:hypothetical protein